MNTPNPLIPQGSLQQQNKGKSNVRIAVFTILAIHVVLLGGLLMQGCGDKTAKTGSSTSTNTLPEPPPVVAITDPMPTPLGTNPAPIVPTTPPVAVVTNPPTPEPPPVVVESNTHVVVKGDIMANIAKKHGVSLKALEAANPGVVATKLKIGQKLQIPGGSLAHGSDAVGAAPAAGGDVKMYIVKSGDTLTKIGKANGGIKTAEIKKLNDLKTDQIKVGQKLKLPSRAVMETMPAPVPAVAVGSTVAPVNATR